LAPVEPVLANHLDQQDVFDAAVDLGRSRANCLGKLGRHADAVPLMRRMITMESKRLGEQHWETLFDRSSLAVHLAETGAADEVSALAADLQPRLASAPPDQAVIATAIRGNLGGALDAAGDWARAAELLNGTAQSLDKLEGPSPSAALMQAHLGRVRLAMGEFQAADEAYLDAYQRMQAVLPGNAQAQALLLSGRVAPLIWLGRSAEALTVVRQASALSEHEGVERRHRDTVRRRLGLALLANGQAPEAVAVLTPLRAAPDVPPSPDAATTLQWLAAAQWASRGTGPQVAAAAAEAASTASAAEAMWRRLPAGRDASVAAELARLGQALARAGSGDAALARTLTDQAAGALKPLWPASHPGWAFVDVARAASMRAAGDAAAAQALIAKAQAQFKQRSGGSLPGEPSLFF
jgi:tetratricopeptide (TPR) repeat protein